MLTRIPLKDLASILDSIADPFFAIDHAEKIVYLNRKAEEVLGVQRDEMAGRALSEVVARESNARFYRELGRSMSECSTVAFEDHSARTSRWYEVYLYPWSGGTSVLLRDITRRKLASHKLRQREAQLAEAQELAHLGSWEWDLEGGKMLWSAEQYRIFGVQPSRFRPSKENFLAQVHPDDRELVRSAQENALTARSSFSLDHRIIRPSGELRIVHARGQVIGGVAGKPLRMIGTSQDVTEQREAEVELLQHADELARSNAELEQFAYVASHDLQEPLRMIASYTQLLARRYRGRLDADADEFIQYVVDGAKRMQMLINDLLAYSRVGTRGRELAPVEMEAVLSQALMNLRGAIEEGGASVIRAPMPRVVGDEGQLVQLFQNLIGNAIKFRGERPPRVEVSALRCGSEWEFRIKDNGIGIEEAYFERIFAIFQRLHGHGEYAGTGIGLAICKKIVERHMGRIWVESTPGRGTTFRFTLQAVEEPTAETAETGEPRDV